MLRLSAHAGARAGIITVALSESDVDGVAAAVRNAAGDGAFSAMLVFFSSALDAAALAATLKRDVDIPVQVGCSTAGEIGPFGMTDGGAVALLFPAETFRCFAGLVTQISRHGFERGIACAQQLKERCAEMAGGAIEHAAFAVTLIDGLSNCEEVMVSAFQTELREIPHVGGSAGDGLAFRQTWIIHDGLAYSDAAILCLFHSTLPFKIFKSDHYEPTDIRLVVTECDQERRIVTEINGAPACAEYAHVTGLDAATLSPMSFASHPLMVKIGGDYFCRSIRRVEKEGLSFFCAIDNGVVLTLARRRDLAESIDDALGLLAEEMGGIDLVLGFDCVLRRVEAQDRQLTHRVAELYRHYNVVGFSTYGEQYKAMHINQTFTGIVFGRAGGCAQAGPAR